MTRNWSVEIDRALAGNYDDRKTVIRVSQSGLDRLHAIFEIAIADTKRRERARIGKIINQYLAGLVDAGDLKGKILGKGARRGSR